MYKDAKRFVEKKIKNLNYVNAILPEEYENVNSQYKKIKEHITLLEAVIKSLSNYEYGGTILKNFSHWSSIIAETSKIKFLKKDDIYTDTSFVGSQLAESISDNKTKNVCENFSVAYEKIAENKREMNSKMDEILAELNSLKKKIKQIDYQRKKVNDNRFDLEDYIQNASNKDLDQEKTLKKIFDSSHLSAKIEMKNFIEISLVNGLLKKIAKNHREFCKNAAEELNKI